MSDLLSIYLKEAVPGAVKTRLARTIGDEDACTLYKAFTKDTLFLAESFQHELWYGSHPVHPHGKPWFVQQGADLGARMAHTIDSGLKHADKVVIIGTDSPTLPVDYVKRAFVELDEADVVFGPTSDGGYYLIGAQCSLQLSDIRWSSKHALQDTIAKNAQLQSTMLPPWFDVDDQEDLRLLSLQLASSTGTAPETRAAMERLASKS